jgi:hypothetical protein
MKVDMLNKLLGVFTEEQLGQLAEQAVIVRDRAMTRKCTQTLTVEINDKGYVRYFFPSDTVPAIKPKNYQAE